MLTVATDSSSFLRLGFASPPRRRRMPHRANRASRRVRPAARGCRRRCRNDCVAPATRRLDQRPLAPPDRRHFRSSSSSSVLIVPFCDLLCVASLIASACKPRNLLAPASRRPSAAFERPQTAFRLAKPGEMRQGAEQTLDRVFPPTPPAKVLAAAAIPLSPHRDGGPARRGPRRACRPHRAHPSARPARVSIARARWSMRATCRTRPPSCAARRAGR